MTHTPTTWTTKRDDYAPIEMVYGSDGSIVARVWHSKHNEKENAALIVTAVNSHASNLALIKELVEALERSVLLLRAAAGAIGQDGHDMDFTHVDGIPTDHIGFETDCENSVERSVSALAKAREVMK